MDLSSSARAGNHLLAHLPLADYQRILPHLQRVSLRLRQVVIEAHCPIDYVYFPERSILSALTVMTDGSAIEAGSVGSEGAAGLSVLLGDRMSLHRIIVQAEDGAMRIGTDQLLDQTSRDGPLRKLLLRCQSAFFSQVSQSAACNGLHPIQKRCCRWLLMTHDRLVTDVLPLTHEFLALMLGVRRPGVTEVLQSLQKQGLVACRRAQITVLDRPGLEAASCDCYRIVKNEYDRLLG